jgi:hypothetical protein
VCSLCLAQGNEVCGREDELKGSMRLQSVSDTEVINMETGIQLCVSELHASEISIADLRVTLRQWFDLSL